MSKPGNRAIATRPGEPTQYKALTKKQQADRVKEEKRNEAKTKKVEYKHKRASQYPSIEDQLDMIYHKGVDAWKAQIAAVKANNPKPKDD